MKKLITICLLFATSCFAQIEGEGLDHGKLGLNRISSTIDSGLTAIDSIANAVGTGVTLADRVKDTYPALYGFKKLWSGASDSCVILRRSSDNAELSFGFVNDLLDTASIRTWAGTDTLYVVSWHDQSGNYNDAIQTTAGNQPIYNDSLAIRFDDTDDYLRVTDNATINFGSTTDFSLLAKVKRNAGTFIPIIVKRKQQGPTYQGYQLHLNTDNKLYAIVRDAGVTQVYPVSSSTIGADWVNISGTFNRDGNAQLYINSLANGTPLNMTSVGDIDYAHDLLIGRTPYYYGGNAFYINNGLISKYALTQTQIESINTYLNQ